MGEFKVGDRVRVVDGSFSEAGRVAEVDRRDQGYNVLHFADPESVICTYFTDDELELVESAPSSVAVEPLRKPAPVRRPKGRFTVREGQTLRLPVSPLFDHYPLSGRRWFR